MSLPVTPSAVLSFTFHNDLNGDANVRSKLYFAYTGGAPSNTDCNTLAAGAEAAWAAHLSACFSNTTSMFLTECVDLATSNGGVGQSSTATNGTLTGGVLPVDLCALVNHKIARKYRGGKPRTYFSMGDETKLNTDGRTWTTGFISLVNTNYAAFVTAMAAVTGGSTNVAGPVNVSYYKGYLPPTVVNNRAKNHLAPRATPVVDPITSSSLNSLIASQRRRVQR